MIRERLKTDELSAIAFEQILSPHHLDHERLAEGHFEGGKRAQKDGERHYPGDSHPSGRSQHPERERLAHHEALKQDDSPVLVDPVRQNSAVEREGQDRQRAEGADQPDFERGIGQLQHQPSLGHGLHPCPTERNELASEEETKIPVTECGEGVGGGHGGRVIKTGNREQGDGRRNTGTG